MEAQTVLRCVKNFQIGLPSLTCEYGALKIYTEDEEGKVIGESNGEQYVDLRAARADQDEAIKGRKDFWEWMRHVLFLVGAALSLLVMLPVFVSHGSIPYSLLAIFMAVLGSGAGGLKANTTRELSDILLRKLTD